MISMLRAEARSVGRTEQPAAPGLSRCTTLGGGVMRDLRLRSVLLGVAVDKLAAVLTVGALLWRFGLESQTFQVGSLVDGFVGSTLGAYVAARHAGRRPLAHGVAVGLVGLFLSVSRFLLTPYLAAPGSPRPHSVSWEIVAWLSVVAAGFVGGVIASRRSEPHAA